MNTGNSGKKVDRGFTLMELMVVISLIAVLAGMVLAAMPAILHGVKTKQVRLTLAELEAGLSSYHLDNGMYPINPASDMTQAPVEGAYILYKYLSGDFDEDGKLDPEAAGTKIYVEGIDWDTAKKQAQQRVATDGSRYMLVDPFGSPIRYLAEPPGKKDKQTRNPTYDLWSLGGADSGSTATEDRSKWITNWDS